MALDSDIEQLQKELRHWKQTAIYLADVHAANLQEAQHSTCSRQRRERFRTIMTTAAVLLRKQQDPQSHIRAETDDALKSVIARLEDHAKKIP